jgi:hypothetical protein
MVIIIPESPIPFEELPLEKQLVHHAFRMQIRQLSLTEAQQLLEALHHLYLGQSSVIAKLTKAKLP